MKKTITYLFILIGIILLGFSASKEKVSLIDIKCISTQKTYEAGEGITLQFLASEKILPRLYYSNSYGATLINPRYQNNILSYTIPQQLNRKSGLVNWKLLFNDNTISGQFNITPKTSITSLETYIGPPSINAGGKDFTMLVVIPTDVYDNPVKDSTKVAVKHQFLLNETTSHVFTNHLIAYKSIYSEEKTGRILMSSECLGMHSKEYDVNILAHIPTNFTINYKRNHEYADANQITTFSTSIVKDEFGNIVSDGTYINFFITNKAGHILKTSGTTLRGIATAKMIHPDEEEQWTVKAFINGLAESNAITLNYKRVILDFKTALSKNNRTITVGPLQSFMKQLIPDGLEVTLSVYKNNTLIKRFKKQSHNGFATFNLNGQFLKAETHEFRIETAGLEKVIITKLL